MLRIKNQGSKEDVLPEWTGRKQKGGRAMTKEQTYYPESDILHYAVEIRRDKNQPHTYANAPLAEAVYRKLSVHYPSASLYREGAASYICITRRAEKVLAQRCRAKIEIMEAQLNETRELLEGLEKGKE